ncbi:Choline transporter-like protein 2 [Larimichthys crocea]|uniref:Uncharacterized protein n=1 Tax=Larimichthys crocea TaxID=215358 RepID=A0ACD3RTN6_LARCR|nr:Choline transporter-like protein 2 [Larimichthys crocea]
MCQSSGAAGVPVSHHTVTRRCLPALGTRKKNGVVVVGNETTIDTGEGTTVNATDVLEASKKSNMVVEARQVAMRIFEDYTQSWYWILLGLVIAMVVSLIFIVLLRYLAGIMIWVMIVLVILVIGYGIFHCFMEFKSLKGEPGADVTIRDLGLQTDFSVYLQIRQTWLAFMIILAIVEVIIILLLIFLRKRIMIAIALIKEASSFLSTSNEQVYKVFNNTQPCEYALETCDPKTFNTSNVSAQCPEAECLFAFYGGETLYHKYLILFQFYNVFLFFWCANFVTALGQVTLSGAFASYYWAFKKPEDIPAYPIFASLGRALRYHTGSLAFGSLILSLVQVIRVILEYLDHKLKGAQNKCAKFMLSCMKCCFWCLEKCIKFLNRNAYIMFCATEKVLMCVIFFTQTLVVGSYLIAHGFFSVYAMCVDTLFLCFCEDLERNDGSSERPYFMSPELHEILSKAKRVEDDDGVEQTDSAKQVDEVKLEEETPLQQQQDGEIQLKEQTVLKQENEEAQPLQSKTDAEEPQEEKNEEEKVSGAEETEKKEEEKEEVKEAVEKQELKQEEKAEEAPPPAVDAEKEGTGEKKEETQEENPPSAPQE